MKKINKKIKSPQYFPLFCGYICVGEFLSRNIRQQSQNRVQKNLRTQALPNGLYLIWQDPFYVFIVSDNYLFENLFWGIYYNEIQYLCMIPLLLNPAYRHPLSDFLKSFGGNIGYSIRPSERRKGYASQMLNLILPICRPQALRSRQSYLHFAAFLLYMTLLVLHIL